MNKRDILFFRFNQEFLSITFLINLLIVEYFLFPPDLRLASPWNVIVLTLMFIVIIIGTIWIFCFPEEFIKPHRLEFLPDNDFGNNLKKIYACMFIIIFFGGMSYYWYVDYFRMPSAFYIMEYLNYIVIIILFKRALKNDMKNNYYK